MNYGDMAPETKQALSTYHAKIREVPPIDELPKELQTHFRKLSERNK